MKVPVVRLKRAWQENDGLAAKASVHGLEDGEKRCQVMDYFSFRRSGSEDPFDPE